MEKTKKVFLIFALVISMLAQSIGVFAAETEDVEDLESKNEVVVQESMENEISNESKSQVLLDLLHSANNQLRDNDVVPVIVELNTNYFNKDYSENYDLSTEEGRESKVRSAQEILNRAKDLINDKYRNFEIKYDLNLLLVGFSAESSFGDLKKLAEEEYIKKIILCTEFQEPMDGIRAVRSISNIDMIEAGHIHSNYKGQGMVVAVLDTGTDIKHESMYLSEPNKAKLNKDKVRDLKLKGRINYGLYHNEKIPFYHNYAANEIRGSEDVKEQGRMHGMHVAGIAVGNKVTLHDKNEFIGVAPEAQLLAMRVFDKGGTSPAIYIKAIEDSIKLGACSINMSLGSPSGNVYETDAGSKLEGYIGIGDYLKKAREMGCVVAIACGNDGYFGYGYQKPDANNPDYGLVGTPAVATYGLSVASMENNTVYEHVLTLKNGSENKIIPYKWGNDNLILKYGQEYTYVDCGKGSSSDIKDEVKGQLALVERGDILFTEKIENAKAKGAIGVVIYNSEDGGDNTFGINVQNSEIPSVTIGRTDGLKLKEVTTGKLVFSEEEESRKNPIAGEISEFSSWGLSSSGTFKPEILSPGGRIYSTLNDNKYGEMSGTSMACPHVAGAIAIVRQRVEKEFNSLSNQEKFDLVRAILMSTAAPHKNKNGEISSPRHQGAGVMNLNAAVNTKAIITCDKSVNSALSLGNVGDKFEFDITVKNISDKTLKYGYYVNVTTDEVKDNKFTLNPKLLYKTQKKEIEIPPKGNVPVHISVDTTTFKEKLQNQMPNGYFVEGFVVFESDTETPISFPFVGFNGDWNKLPVLEPSIYELAKQNRVPFYYDFSKNEKLFTCFTTFLDYKEIIAGQVDNFDPENPKFEDVLVVSPNSDGNLDKINFRTTYLRNHRGLELNLYEANGDDLGRFIERIGGNDGGIKHHGGKGSKNSQGFQWHFGPGRRNGTYYLETSVKPIPLFEGSEFTQKNKYKVIVDTKAPIPENVLFENNTLTFDIYETGSGIKYEKVYYKDGNDKKYVEKTDGKYMIPTNISEDNIYIELLDKGYNKQNVTVGKAKNLEKDFEDGTITVKITDPKGNDVTDRCVYKIKDNSGIEVDGKKLSSGYYSVQVLECPNEFKTPFTKNVKLDANDKNKVVELQLLSRQPRPNEGFKVKLEFKKGWTRLYSFKEGTDYIVDGIYREKYDEDGNLQFEKISNDLFLHDNGKYFVKIEIIKDGLEIDPSVINNKDLVAGKYFLVRGEDNQVKCSITLKETGKTNTKNIVKKIAEEKIDVNYATELSDISVPKSVKITHVKMRGNDVIEDEMVDDIKVSWDMSNYDAITSGEQTFYGDLDADDMRTKDIQNINNIIPVLKVNVATNNFGDKIENLKSIVQEVEELDKNNHKKDSINQLEGEIEKAKAILNDNRVLQSEIEEAIKNLMAAKNRFLKEEIEKPTPKPNVKEQISDRNNIQPEYNYFRISVNSKATKKDEKKFEREKSKYGLNIPSPYLTPNFTDVLQNLSETVNYLAKRGIMVGTDDKSFSPKEPMSRAMVVTTLYRISEDKNFDRNTKPFTDVKETDWFYESVLWAKEKGLISGYEKGDFKPNKNLSRQEFAVLIAKFLKYHDIKMPELYKFTYKDESEIPQWSKESVELMKKIGLIEGRDENNYKPYGEYTREELAITLYKLIKFCENN